MKTERSLLIVFVVLLALAGGIFYFNRDRQYVSEEVAGDASKVFPGFPTESIHTMVLTNRFGTLTFHQRGEEWVIAEKEDYPASGLRVNGVLDLLAELSVIQRANLGEAHWERLGVLDPKLSPGKGSGDRIDLLGPEGYHAALIAGKLQASNSEAALVFGEDYDGRRFFRTPGKNEVYLADNSLSFLNTIPSHWIKNTLSNPYAYRRISYVDKGEPVWTMSRESRDQPYLLQGPDQGEGVLLPKLSTDIDYTFSSLVIRDAMPSDLDPAKVMITGDRYVELESLNGDLLRLDLGGKVAVPEQERHVGEEATGFFRAVVEPSQRYVMMTWPRGRKEPPPEEPPYGNRVYLVASAILDDLLINYDEMRIFERLRPSDQQASQETKQNPPSPP